MKPLRLRLTGVRSYADETTVDFEGRGLVAIVGDTGAGKSSLLEAMVYALYNRSTFEGRSRDLISHNADTMTVSLDFEVEGRRHRVTRSRSITGSPPARHELVALDDPSRTLDGEVAVTGEIERLVGLGPAAFLKTVVLPQGRFAELLRATPTDRARVLRDIFRLEHLEVARDEARATRDRAEEALHPLRAERGRLPEDPDAEIAARRAEHAAADGAHATLASAAREYATASRRADEAARRAGEARSMVRALDIAAGAEAVVAMEEAERAQRELDERAAAAAGRSRELERRHAELAAAGDRSRDDGLAPDALAAAQVRLTDMARRAGRAGELRRAADAADRAVSTTRSAAEAASHTADDARHADERAVEAVAETGRAATAAELIHGHAAGDPCPVCRQDLPAEVIDADPASGALAAARRRATDARSLLAEAERARAEADRAWSDASAESRRLRDALESELEAKEHARREVPASLRPDPGCGPDGITAALAGVERRRAAHEEERRLLGAVEEERRRIEREARDLEVERTRRVVEPRGAALRALDRLHDAAVRAAALSGASAPPRLPDAPYPAAAAARELLDAAQASAESADALAGEADRDGLEARTLARSVAEAHGQADGERLVEARDRAAGARAATERALALAEEQAPRARELDGRMGPALAMVDDLRAVERALAPSGFPRHAARARQHALIDVAKEILGHMTGGRYALDADFGVVDRTLGGRRGVRTLSGGETFLASLALSLALVEMTDRSGGRVEALFLDEGFGQLDADALDAALAELAFRARDGRLVAVVSHVHAVAERVEDVLHVTADDAGSSSARWLGPDERRALLDRDAAGLVAL